MSVDEVKIKIAGFKLDTKYIGLDYVEGEDSASFRDSAHDARFKFLDEKLYSLEVKYDSSTKWEKYEFVGKVKEE